MQPQPLVSIIIPAYNAEKTVRNAVDSVLRQTITDLEVIVVDDASTDGTSQTVNTIADPRVRLLQAQKNSGPSASRNLGIRDARGCWLAFLDADDEYTPDRLEQLIEAGHGRECYVGDRMANCIPGPNGHLRPLQNTELPRDPTVENFGFTALLNWHRTTLPIVARSALERTKIEFPEWGSGGDWQFVFAKLSARGVRGRLINRVGYLRRVTGSHDSSTLRAIEEQLKVQEFLASDPEVPEEARAILRKGAPGIRKRMLVAALRENKWRKMAHYASRNPADLLILPGSVLRFIWRKIRYAKASRMASVTDVS